MAVPGERARTGAFLAALSALLQPGGLVALDEPERSLHPDALYRLIGAARMVSAQRSVVLATQSDRLLSFLDDMPEAIVIVRPGEQGTELVKPDAGDLANWLKDFSLADMRHELETWGLRRTRPLRAGWDRPGRPTGHIETSYRSLYTLYICDAA